MGTTLCHPGIAVVQPADLRDGNGPPAAGRFDLTGVRGFTPRSNSPPLRGSISRRRLLCRLPRQVRRPEFAILQGCFLPAGLLGDVGPRVGRPVGFWYGVAGSALMIYAGLH